MEKALTRGVFSPLLDGVFGGKNSMEKYYEALEMEIVLFSATDIVRTSFGDNVTEFPEYPENFE